jgi:hypothetical protein
MWLNSAVYQVRYSFGENYLGYKISWQGQKMWRALPSTPACPLSGQTKYALYIKPASIHAPVFTADFKCIPQTIQE